jgi:hypothetical protein
MIKKISKEYKEAKPKEVWVEGVLYNTIYGFLGAVVIVALTLKIDIAVLLSYLAYYFFLGKVVNRPKYVTSLGKFIVFPIPTTLGAFLGYKMAPYLITLIQ